MKRPLRLTRLRSQLAGAPSIMHGLDSNNRATEALPPDPDDMPMAEVRSRLPRSHPLSTRKIKLILRTSRSRSSPSQEKHEPPRRPMIRLKIWSRAGGSATTGHGQGNPVVKPEPTADSFDNTGLIRIPEPASPPPLPVMQVFLNPAYSSSPDATHPDSPTVKEDPGFFAIKQETE